MDGSESVAKVLQAVKLLTSKLRTKSNVNRFDKM